LVNFKLYLEFYDVACLHFVYLNVSWLYVVSQCPMSRIPYSIFYNVLYLISATWKIALWMFHDHGLCLKLTNLLKFYCLEFAIKDQTI
jgi:hypothetical protein